MLQNTLINHVSLVVDKSASMSPHSTKVVEVFDRELNYLKQRSIDLNQETRISIYLFDTQIEVLAFDMDVMRFNSLKSFYRLGSSTALIDATVQSIQDNLKLPEVYGDHAFLQYVITDGEENQSRKNTASSLQQLIGGLRDNWTTAILVPDARGEKEAIRFGFNAGSIAIWDTQKDFEGVGTQFKGVMDNYMAMRATGVRGTKNLFTLDTTKVTKADLQELPTSTYDVYPVTQDAPIKQYVESFSKKKYRLGSSYYQPTKPVTIQDHKNILLQEIKTGKVFYGYEMRNLLGLPQATAQVNPGNHKDWRIFVQSTSVNRKLFKDTFVLVRS